MDGKSQLTIAAILSFIAAVLHIAIIFGGPEWYRFFGAGEQMAQLAEAGSAYPTQVTLFISGVLAVWGLYALSGAGLIFKLPGLKAALILITAVLLARGMAGLILPFVSNHPAITQNSITFWIVSSMICSWFGLYYLKGTVYHWEKL